MAGEVRNLASRSADAAKDTLAYRRFANPRERGSELAQQAGETMDEIATEVCV